MAKLIGTNPNQVPTNADLGSMAYQDANNAKIGGLAYPSSDGTNGQVLTTNGSGTLSFVDAASGGVTLLSTATASASSSLTFTLPTSGYAYFRLAFDGLRPSSNGENLYVKVYGTSGNYLYSAKEITPSSESRYSSTGNSNGVRLTNSQYNINAAGANGEFTIFQSATNSVPAYGTFAIAFTDDNSNLVYSNGAWKTGNTEVQTSVQINYGVGNIEIGSARLYGITA